MENAQCAMRNLRITIDNLQIEVGVFNYELRITNCGERIKPYFFTKQP